ncbi:MAG: hypothetical protein J0H09_03500 [Burkholderiales bacterium]|nr:hypothetical protein [Burkholderiales bacterium]
MDKRSSDEQRQRVQSSGANGESGESQTNIARAGATEPHDDVQSAAFLVAEAYREIGRRADWPDLATRHAAGDPHVFEVRDPDGSATYEVSFTADERTAICDAYAEARPAYRAQPERLQEEFEVFVAMLEGWANWHLLDAWRNPIEQKARRRSLEAIAGALEGVRAAILELDLAATGFVYAKIADAIAQIMSSADGQPESGTPMVDRPLEAMSNAAEMRRDLLAYLGPAAAAARQAADELPHIDRSGADTRLVTARALRAELDRHGIPFQTSGAGFSAIALRATFELAGLRLDRIDYWLRKAAEE